MAKSSRQIGDIRFKDAELIKGFFDKLNSMLDEREDGGVKERKPLNYETAVYGSFLNFVPRHYIFDGFESDKEFRKHLVTLLQWQTGEKTEIVESQDSISDL